MGGWGGGGGGTGGGGGVEPWVGVRTTRNDSPALGKNPSEGSDAHGADLCGNPLSRYGTCGPSGPLEGIWPAKSFFDHATGKSVKS